MKEETDNKRNRTLINITKAELERAGSIGKKLAIPASRASVLTAAVSRGLTLLEKDIAGN